MVNQHSFKGIQIHERLIKITQLADDTTIFLGDSDEAHLAFSKLSGLNLNLEDLTT